jgi:hypothetical protein
MLLAILPRFMLILIKLSNEFSGGKCFELIRKKALKSSKSEQAVEASCVLANGEIEFFAAKDRGSREHAFRYGHKNIRKR